MDRIVFCIREGGGCHRDANFNCQSEKRRRTRLLGGHYQSVKLNAGDAGRGSGGLGVRVGGLKGV